MEAPPPYSGGPYMAPPKKSKTGLILGIVALVVVLCCCGGGGALFWFGRSVIGKAFGLVECGVAVGEQRDGLVGYANAHGGQLPKAASWQDDIRPYVTKNPEMGDQKMIVIPGPEAAYCDKGGGTSITYNSDIAGKKVSDVKDGYGTMALFETAGTGRNKAAPFKEQPFETSPVLVKGQRRGWIVQPLKGQGSYKDQFGNQQPVPGANRRRFRSGEDDSAGPVDVTSSKDKPAKGAKAPPSEE